MFTRLTTRFLRNGISTQSSRRLMSDYGENLPQFRRSHMDEYPVPNGSWKEAYDKRQSKYNKQLFAGFAFYIFTLAWIYNDGCIDLVLAPPMKNE